MAVHEAPIEAGWVTPASKVDLVTARREGRLIEAWHEVAGEWHPSPVAAEMFEKWGPGPTIYRVSET